MNIVPVVFDSLRKDCTGCYGPAPGRSDLAARHSTTRAGRENRNNPSEVKGARR